MPRKKTDPQTIAAYRKQQRERWSGPELRHVELLYLIHTMSRLISVRFDRALAQQGITHSQWWALVHIYENEGVTQSELATIMQLGRASAGWLLERLEQRGWVARRPDPKDSRMRRVFLGDAAVSIFQMMDREVPTLFATFFSDLSETQEAELLESLQSLRRNAESKR